MLKLNIHTFYDTNSHRLEVGTLWNNYFQNNRRGMLKKRKWWLIVCCCFTSYHIGSFLIIILRPLNIRHWYQFLTKKKQKRWYNHKSLLYKTAVYEKRNVSIMKGKLLSWENAHVLIFNYNFVKFSILTINRNTNKFISSYLYRHFHCNRNWCNIPKIRCLQVWHEISYK